MKMNKNIIIFCFLTFYFGRIVAQSTQINSLNIAVFVPQTVVLNDANNEKLKSKMIQF